jgi:nucleoside-diphosphate-sugar epimerase
MRVLVTGASGFLGTALCEGLLDAGAEVHGVSRRDRPLDTDVRWHRVDVADADAVDRTMGAVNPDVVYHLASAVSGRRDLDFVAPTLQANLVAAVNVLTAASRTSRPRVLLAGSMEEVDAEDVEPVPGSPYAAAKTATSAYARMFHALYGLDMVVLRTFMAYGPGQWDTTKIVPYVTTSLLRGRTPRLASGRRKVDWIHVADVVDAYLRAGLAPDIAGATLPVGSGRLTSIRTVVERIAQLVGGEVRPEFGILPDRPLERPRRADVAVTESAIGWHPSRDLDDGLAETVEWFRARVRSQAAV